MNVITPITDEEKDAALAETCPDRKDMVLRIIQAQRETALENASLRNLLEMNNTCFTCCGVGSTKDCICGGTGRHADEMTNIRLEAIRAQQRVLELEKENRFLRERLAHMCVSRAARTWVPGDVALLDDEHVMLLRHWEDGRWEIAHLEHEHEDTDPMSDGHRWLDHSAVPEASLKPTTGER